MTQRMMRNFFYQEFTEWNDFKKRYCKSCVNKVYCLLNEDANNQKAIPTRKNKKIICLHYKARYLKEVTNV